jgi:hypothetical protein
MPSNLMLSDEEWRLIRELLEREQSQLSVEIHHSRTGSFKHALRDRYDVISNILIRATGSKPPDPAGAEGLHH